MSRNERSRRGVGAVALVAATMAMAQPAAADCDAMPAAQVDWNGCDKYKTTLSGMDFAGADLTKAVLARSDLRKSNLTGATLAEADLNRAVLDNAKLVKAVLDKADFGKSRLQGTDLSGATGATYRVEFATSLTTPVDWTPLTTFALVNSPFTVSNTLPATDASGFYRAVLVP